MGKNTWRGRVAVVYKDAAGKFRWRLVAANGKNIADSGQGYYRKKDCLAGLDQTISDAPRFRPSDAGGWVDHRAMAETPDAEFWTIGQLSREQVQASVS